MIVDITKTNISRLGITCKCAHDSVSVQSKCSLRHIKEEMSMCHTFAKLIRIWSVELIYTSYNSECGAYKQCNLCYNGFLSLNFF